MRRVIPKATLVRTTETGAEHWRIEWPCTAFTWGKSYTASVLHGAVCTIWTAATGKPTSARQFHALLPAIKAAIEKARTS